MNNKLGSLLAGLYLLIFSCGHLNAQESPVGEAITGSTGDLSLTVTTSHAVENISIANRTVTIAGATDSDASLFASSNVSMFSVREGGTLKISNLRVEARGQSPDKPSAMFILDGGTLELDQCNVGGSATFAIYAYRGEVIIKDCVFGPGTQAVSGEDGTRLRIEGTTFNGFKSSAVSLDGTSSSMIFKGSSVSNSQRGIGIGKGAELSLSFAQFDSISEVALLARSASIKASDLFVNQATKFGIYLQNPGASQLSNVIIKGETNTGVRVAGEGSVSISGAQMSNVKFGVVLPEGNINLQIENSVFASPLEDSVHVTAQAGHVNIKDTVFSGGRIAVASKPAPGVEQTVSGSVFLDQNNAGIILLESGGSGSALISENKFITGPKAVSVSVEKGQNARVDYNLFAYQGLALSVATGSSVTAERNSFVGSEDPLVSGSGMRKTALAAANRMARPESARSAFDALQSLSAGDVEHWTAISDSFSNNVSELAKQTDAPLPEQELALVSLEIQGSTPPAPEVEIAELHRGIKVDGKGAWAPLGMLQAMDFPLRLLPGEYVFRLVDGKQVRFELAAGGSAALSSTTQPLPYGAVARNGQIVRQREFKLRSKKELLALQRKRWPGGKFFYDRTRYPVPRAGASAEDRQAALAYARASLKQTHAQLMKVPEGIAFGSMDENGQKLFRAAIVDIREPLAILVAIGELSDADSLFEMVKQGWIRPSPFLQRSMAHSVVRLLSRLDAIPGSSLEATWRSLPDGDKYLLKEELAIYLSAAGYRPAVEYLADQIAVKRAHVSWGQIHLAQQAVPFVALVEKPEVLEFFLEIVDAYTPMVENSLLKQEVANEVAGVLVFQSFPVAYSYAAAHLPENQLDRLAVPIPVWLEMAKIAHVLENPEGLLEHMLGGPPGRYYNRKFSQLLPLYCNIIAGRKADAQARIDESFRQSLYASFLREKTGRIDRLYADRDMRVLADYHGAVCGKASKAVGAMAAPDNYESWYLPGWMAHGFYTVETALKQVSEGKVDTVDKSLDRLSRAALQKAIEQADLGNNPVIKNYLLRHAVSTHAFQHRAAISMPSTNDVRGFMEPSEKPSGGVMWLGAKVSLAPRITGDRKLFGISLELGSHETNGLAAAIARRPERAQPLLENFARKMIKRVVLRHGDSETELNFVTTTKTGTHVFELTSSPETTSNLLVDVVFASVDDEWTVSFPLYASPLGFQLMMQNGNLRF